MNVKNSDFEVLVFGVTWKMSYATAQLFDVSKILLIFQFVFFLSQIEGEILVTELKICIP